MASSALALIPAAVVTVPGYEPEKVSDEVEQGLDLDGEWKGTFVWAGRPHPAVFSRGTLVMYRPEILLWSSTDVFDEGQGRFRLKWPHSTVFGIYRREGDSLWMCYGSTRPTSFSAGNDECLLIIRRAKSRK